jgi:uncharacterized protein (UPF0335 family)
MSSANEPDKVVNLQGDKSAKDRLRGYVERIERLEEDKAAIQDDIKEVYGEIKGEGYDTKIVRALIRERKKEEADRTEYQMTFDLYWGAIHGLETKRTKTKKALH